MPYLKKEERSYYNDLIAQIERHSITSPGELNFLVTLLIKQSMKDKTINYSLLNGIVGALDCAKEEFRRRILNPYEDSKIISNSDVY